jgi:hypothetical protein
LFSSRTELTKHLKSQCPTIFTLSSHHSKTFENFWTVPTASVNATHPSKLWCSERLPLVTMSATDACTGQRAGDGLRSDEGNSGSQGMSPHMCAHTHSRCRATSLTRRGGTPWSWSCSAREKRAEGMRTLTDHTKHARMAGHTATRTHPAHPRGRGASKQAHLLAQASTHARGAEGGRAGGRASERARARAGAPVSAGHSCLAR